jgi:hypothetical protein
MISYTVFQFTQRAIENRSTCHSWHACRMLPTPALEGRYVAIASLYELHILVNAKFTYTLYNGYLKRAFVVE